MTTKSGTGGVGGSSASSDPGENPFELALLLRGVDDDFAPRIADKRTELVDAKKQLSDAMQKRRDRLQNELAEISRKIDADHEAAVAGWTSKRDNLSAWNVARQSDLMEQLEDALAELAPGLTGTPNITKALSDPATIETLVLNANPSATGRSPLPLAVRIGNLLKFNRLGSSGALGTKSCLPLAMPVLAGGNARIIYSGSDGVQWSKTQQLINATLMRLLLTVDPHRLNLTIVDPNMRSPLSPIMKVLRSDQSPLEIASLDRGNIPGGFPALTRSIIEDHANAVGAYANVIDAETHDVHVSLDLLLLCDFPDGFDDVSVKALEGLMDRGPDLGIGCLLLCDRDVITKKVNKAVKTAATFRLELVDEDGKLRWKTNLDTKQHYVVSCDDGQLGPDAVRDFSGAYETFVGAIAATTPTLTSVLPDPTDFCTASAVEAIDIPIGRCDGEIYSLILNRDAAHVLIGGTNGSGKSNLLDTIVHSIASVYSPDEVRLLVVDLREGVTFHNLAGSSDLPVLPHLDILGAESDARFALEVLDWLDRERSRRAELIARSGTKDYAQFRLKHPELPLPRLVVVIDEFQVLHEAPEWIADEADRLLISLSRMAGGSGIHLVLASQNLRSSRGYSRTWDAVAAQAKTRIVFSMDKNHVGDFLSMHATQPLKLPRFVCVVNTAAGHSEDNYAVATAHADSDSIRCIRGRLGVLASTNGWATNPQVFESSARPALTADMIRSIRERAVLLGLPVSVSTEPAKFVLPPEPGRNLMIFGSRPEEPLQSILLTAVGQATSPTRLNVIAHPRDDVLEAIDLDGLQILATELGCTFEFWDVSDACPSDADLVAAEDQWVLSVLINADRYLEGDAFASDSTSAVFRRLLSTTTNQRHTIVASWHSVESFLKFFSYNYLSDAKADGYCVSGGSPQDVRQALGGVVERTEQGLPDNRLLLVDRRRQGIAKQGLAIIPFQLLRGPDLAHLTAELVGVPA